MQQRCACEQRAALLALPALSLIVAAEEDIHLPVAHPPVGHWHNVLLQAGAFWIDIRMHASLQPMALSRQTSGCLKMSVQQAYAPAPSDTGMALPTALRQSVCAPVSIHLQLVWRGASSAWDPGFRSLTGTAPSTPLSWGSPRNPTAHKTEAPRARSNSWCSAHLFKNLATASPGLYTSRCAAPLSCWCSCAHLGGRCRRAAWQESSRLQ